MLVKYPPYFTSKLNAMPLPTQAVLLSLIPITRELRLSHLALPIAIVWLIDLVTDVTFTLYVTYLDCTDWLRTPIEAKRKSSDSHETTAPRSHPSGSILRTRWDGLDFAQTGRYRQLHLLIIDHLLKQSHVCPLCLFICTCVYIQRHCSACMTEN